MKNYIVLSPLRYNGKRYEIDAPVDVEDKDAKSLVKNGVIRLATANDQTPAASGNQSGTGNGSNEPPALLGSSVLQGVIAIAVGKEVQLGEVVARAHERSGLTAEEWNALDADRREELLKQEVELMVKEAAEANRPAAPSDPAEREKAIVEAIGKLNVDNRELWLKDGRPDASSLSELLGWQVSASERNVAWEKAKPAK